MQSAGSPARAELRKRTRILLAFLALAFAWVVCAGDGPEPRAARVSLASIGGGSSSELVGPCRTVHVVDGDTVDVRCGRVRRRVRLLNIDTPERGQPGYGRAAAALAERLGGDVDLAFERPGRPSEGRYGRLLAYLHDESGRNLNLSMAREGWAPFDRTYGDDRLPEAFAEGERAARDNAAGLWRADLGAVGEPSSPTRRSMICRSSR